MKRYLNVQDLNAYKIAFELSNYIWNIVITWNYFACDTIGKQWVRAIDSISANIAEGFGRFTKKDKISFYRYSFASISESLDWLEKANTRKLLPEKQYLFILDELNKLPKELHSLIKFTNEKLTI